MVLHAAGGIFFGSHCVRDGIPWSIVAAPGRDPLTCVLCGMGMGREAGILLNDGDHMGIHENQDGIGWDGCVIGGWRDAAGGMWDLTWDPVWDRAREKTTWAPAREVPRPQRTYTLRYIRAHE